MSVTKRCRVLAMEIRSQKLGYAAFESPTVLFDWGVRYFEKGGGLDLSRKATGLIELINPLVILLSHVQPSNRRNGHPVNNAIRIITAQAAVFSVPTKTCSKDELRKHFAHSGRWNKRQVAEAIAKRFPELAWDIPRRKKMWDSEPRKQLIFDAVALGLHFFAATDHSNCSKNDALRSAPDDE